MTSSEKELLVSVDNGKLCCYRVGKNSSPVIVLHGGPGLGCHYLLPQMTNIGNFSSAIFYDQRGAGNSTTTADWQTSPFQTYVRDLEQLREHFKLETFSLIAHSWGAILASRYVLAYPERVSEIIYLNPVPVSSKDYLDFVKHRSQIVDIHKDELSAIKASQAFKQGDPDTVEKFYRIYFKNYFAKPELADTLTLTMSQQAAINNFKVYELFYNYTLENSFDLYQELGKINKKTLIIAGDKDIIPFTYMEKLHQHVPASTLFQIKNCGHFPYIDQPEILFSAIRDFIT